MEHESNCDSYDGKVEDISVGESGSDTLSEVEITDSDSDSSVDIQSLQRTEVKNSGLPHSANNRSTARDNSG
jgi:hypothetical protein